MTIDLKRDKPVDAFRGLAIISMIFVNHAPPNGQMYSPFVHAEWTGWTIADVIFPAFLFLVGYSITLSAKRDREATVPWKRIWQRTVILILLSVVLVNFPYYALDNFTLHGTLFRIGVCYLVASCIYYVAHPRNHVYYLLLALVLQSVLLMIIPTVEGNSLSWPIDITASISLDSAIFGDAVSVLVLSGPAPQGVIPTLGAIASTIFGLLAGQYVRKYQDTSEKVAALMVLGFVLLSAGLVLSNVIPLSKPIWTPSYVLFMAGLSLQVLGALNWLMSYEPVVRWSRFFQVAGMNALAFYLLAQCLQRFLVYGRLPIDGDPVRFRYAIYDYLFAPYFPANFGSLLYTLVFLALCYAVIYWMYRRKIFLRL